MVLTGCTSEICQNLRIKAKRSPINRKRCPAWLSSYHKWIPPSNQDRMSCMTEKCPMYSIKFSICERISSWSSINICVKMSCLVRIGCLAWLKNVPSIPSNSPYVREYDSNRDRLTNWASHAWLATRAGHHYFFPLTINRPLMDPINH